MKTKIITMENYIMTILDYSWGGVYHIHNLPTEEFIEENFDGDWEHWLYEGQDEVDYHSDCYYMVHELKNIEHTKINN
jgi:hypothetical protein